jgi:hypothetical protein
MNQVKNYYQNQLALYIFSLLEEVSVKPITLGWYDKNLQVNVSSITSPSHAHTPINNQLSIEQASKHIKKLPVTRKDDFYGKFN